jgi:hypothetical protein
MQRGGNLLRKTAKSTAIAKDHTFESQNSLSDLNPPQFDDSLPRIRSSPLSPSFSFRFFFRGGLQKVCFVFNGVALISRRSYQNHTKVLIRLLEQTLTRDLLNFPEKSKKAERRKEDFVTCE